MEDFTNNENFDETMYEIDKLMCEIELSRNKQKREEQQRFNSKFLLKFVTFVFLYRAFTMYVDPDYILTNGIEKIFNDLTYEECNNTSTEDTNSVD